MKKENWSSEFGFIMAASGSAVGLGNLWKFPYIVGNNGGALFIIVYFVLLVVMGMPVLMSEMAIGRSTGRNPADACRSLHPKCGFIGVFGIVGAFAILSYYCIVGGWIIRYLNMNILREEAGDASVYFSSFTGSSISPLIYGLIFTIICAVIVIRGVSGGIEKISRIFMPALLLMMIILMVRAVTINGSREGIDFFLKPDFSAIKGARDIFRILISAMGQVFFSLSLGMGTLITYGAYLDKKTSIPKASFYIALIDFIIAVIAGLTVLPAVFAFDVPPQSGSGMIFIALPQVFDELAWGSVFGTAFFLLVLFATITSAISLLEVLTSFLMQKTRIGRAASAVICSAAVFAAGIPVSLSFGVWKNVRIFGMNFYDLMNFVSDNVLMPLGALGISLLCGYIWGTKNVCEEAGVKSSLTARLYGFAVRYAVPVMISVIFVTAITGI